MRLSVAVLLGGLDGDEAHVRALHGLADRSCVSRVVLAPLARQPIRRHELRRHQLDRVTMGLEQPCPVVRPGASLHADGAGWQRRDHLAQPGTRDRGLEQVGLAGLVDAVHGENVLGEIDTNVQNADGRPLPGELTRVRTSHRGTQLPIAATRLVRDREVPRIR